MTTNTLPQRLRDLRAAARPHFQPHAADGTPRPAAFSIVATEARLDDLVTAARECEVLYGWLDRTEWVQTESSTGNLPGSYLGMHRADVMRAEIERLRALQRPPSVECPELTAEEVAGIAEHLRGGPAMVTAEPAGQLVSWQTFDDQNLGRQQQRFDEAMQDLSAIIQQRARLASDLAANLEDNAIRAKLVELGWTPPGEALTHDQLRAEVRAIINVGGTISEQHKIAQPLRLLCKRLGVEL